jgi:CRISPR-associated protein Cas5d
MSSSPPVQVKVWGDLACFTRPEMKVERVTYPVMPPSAARGVLEAIFWKPQFQWRVKEIWVLEPIRHISVLRNEINTRQSYRSATAWIDAGGGFFADQDRAQRHTLALRDVAYIIKADIVPQEPGDDARAKYRDQFRRRVRRGQCLHRPYLGCREFAADFAEPTAQDVPTLITDDLGLMLGDLVYSANGTATPKFFQARLESGVLRVPHHAIYG